MGRTRPIWTPTPLKRPAQPPFNRLRNSPAFVSSLFLNREPVLLGYSLDDPDMREILTLLRERLGRMTRAVWAILPTDPHKEEPKFVRRGLKPIVLNPDTAADRSTVLAQFFEGLRTLWEQEVASRLSAGSDASTAELRRRSGIAPQLGLFVASRAVLSLYRDFVFPAVPQSGLIPLGVDDIQAPDPRTAPMAIDTALSKAAVVVYDTGRGSELPLDYVAARRKGKPIVVVTGEQQYERDWLMPRDVTPQPRPADMSVWPEQFVPPLIDAMRAAQSPSSLPDQLKTLPTSVPADQPAPQATTGPAPDLPDQLKELRERGDWFELLLTSLALLEAELRGSEAPELGVTVMPTSLRGGRMARLREYFDFNFNAIVAGVGLRHDLLHNLTRQAGSSPSDASWSGRMISRGR